MGNQNEVRRFKADGGFTLAGVLMLTALSVVAATLLGAVAHFAGRFFYLIALFPIAMGLGVGAACGLAVRRGKMRNWLVVVPLAALAAVAAGLTMHYCDYAYFMSQKDYDPEIDNVVDHFEEYKATYNQQPANIQQFVNHINQNPNDLAFFRARSLPSYLHYMATEGVTLTKAGRSKGVNLGYVGSFIYWGVELLIIAGMAVVISKAATCEPYCLQCDRWKESRTVGSLDISAETALATLESGDLTGLHGLGTHHEDGPLLLSIWVCPNCGASAPFEVRLLKVVQKDKGKTENQTLGTFTMPGAMMNDFLAIFGASESETEQPSETG